MADNNIPEHEKELVISFYEAQKTLRDIFNVLSVQDENIDSADFIVGYAQIIAQDFDCTDSQREELTQFVKTIVSDLVEGTVRRVQEGQSDTEIRFHHDFLMEAFPGYMAKVAHHLGHISENAVKYTPIKPKGLH